MGWLLHGSVSFIDLSCHLCLSYPYFPVCFFAALWSPFGKRTDLLALLYVMPSCVFVTFPYGVLGQVWYLIVSIPDLFHLSYLISLPTSTLYTIIMPFYAFEISYILKVFKTLLKLFLNFFF